MIKSSFASQGAIGNPVSENESGLDRGSTYLRNYFSLAEATVADTLSSYSSTNGTVRDDLSVAGIGEDQARVVADWIEQPNTDRNPPPPTGNHAEQYPLADVAGSSGELERNYIDKFYKSAENHLLQGNLDKALAFSRKYLGLIENLDYSIPDGLNEAYLLIAMNLWMRSDWEGALQIVSKLRAESRLRSRLRADVERWIAQLYLLCKDYANAKLHATNAWKTDAKHFGEGSLEYIESTFILKQAYRKIGEWEEAEIYDSYLPQLTPQTDSGPLTIGPSFEESIGRQTPLSWRTSGFFQYSTTTPNLKGFVGDREAYKQWGSYRLILASAWGLEDTVKWFLEPKGFTNELGLIDDPELINFSGGHLFTALHYAAQNNHLKVAQMLIGHGATIDGRSSDFPNSRAAPTPLCWAGLAGNAAMVELLLDNGAVLKPVEKNFSIRRWPRSTSNIYWLHVQTSQRSARFSPCVSQTPRSRQSCRGLGGSLWKLIVPKVPFSRVEKRERVT